jgi:hypothetical protein
VRDGRLTDDILLSDPWGGADPVHARGGPPIPFLWWSTASKLTPGPDSVVGSSDDVRNPFERVLRSRTPCTPTP